MLLSRGGFALLLFVFVEDLLLDHLFNVFDSVIVFSVDLVVEDEFEKFEQLDARFAGAGCRDLS